MSEDLSQTVAPKISIVIPAFNEAQNLPVLLQQIHATFEASGIPLHECIIVNDASTDQTDEVVRGLAQQYLFLRYLKMDRNSGQSAALLAGMRATTGDFIFTMDADLQNDPRDIPRMLPLLEKYHCVCGYRATRQDSLARRLTSYLGNLVRRWIVDDGIRDAGCGLKGFRRECIMHLLPFHGVHRFFASMVRNAGLTVTEVPVGHNPRLHGISKYGFSNRLFWVLFDFVGVAWLKKRYLLISYHEEKVYVVKAEEIFDISSCKKPNAVLERDNVYDL